MADHDSGGLLDRLQSYIGMPNTQKTRHDVIQTISNSYPNYSPTITTDQGTRQWKIDHRDPNIWHSMHDPMVRPAHQNVVIQNPFNNLQKINGIIDNSKKFILELFEPMPQITKDYLEQWCSDNSLAFWANRDGMKIHGTFGDLHAMQLPLIARLKAIPSSTLTISDYVPEAFQDNSNDGVIDCSGRLRSLQSSCISTVKELYDFENSPLRGLLDGHVDDDVLLHCIQKDIPEYCGDNKAEKLFLLSACAFLMELTEIDRYQLLDCSDNTDSNNEVQLLEIMDEDVSYNPVITGNKPWPAIDSIAQQSQRDISVSLNIPKHLLFGGNEE